jgi:hypothetical protein
MFRSTLGDPDMAEPTDNYKTYLDKRDIIAQQRVKKMALLKQLELKKSSNFNTSPRGETVDYQKN